MIRVGLNGFGRIGRAIFRIFSEFDDIEIVAINDLNPESENMAYLLKYDSYYGRFNHSVEGTNSHLSFDGREIPITHEQIISNVDWLSHGCDAIIEAAGTHYNLNVLPSLIKKGIKKIIVTYAPEDVDHHVVLGANEDTYNPDVHHIISSSICDVVSFAPVYKLLDDNFGVAGGFLTTLHPWLSYQNLLDGPSQSWGFPGTLYKHYGIGRASTASIIPKPTTAINAAEKIFPGVLEKMRCYSFRVPTPVVGAADITFNLKSEVSIYDMKHVFNEFTEHQKWPILHINSEPLVSVDFTGTDYSAVIDTRWMDTVNGHLVNITLWYDNEWGYSRRVTDLLRFVFQKEPKFFVQEAHALVV